MSAFKMIGMILTLLIVTSQTHPARCESFSMQHIGLEIRDMILSEDVPRLARHVRARIFFIDESYSKQELLKLLKNEKSWIQKSLFIGSDSIKYYIETAKDLNVVIMHNDLEDVISYQSSNYPPHMWPWCSIIIENGQWYFTDMFAYR